MNFVKAYRWMFDPHRRGAVREFYAAKAIRPLLWYLGGTVAYLAFMLLRPFAS